MKTVLLSTSSHPTRKINISKTRSPALVFSDAPLPDDVLKTFPSFKTNQLNEGTGRYVGLEANFRTPSVYFSLFVHTDRFDYG